jgi:hypothetical protein
LSLLFSAILWDIDLIFCMWVYNDQLQIKFTFRSGPMIFGWVMALGLSNLVKYLVVTTLFHYDLRYWLYFWHMSVLWWATDQVYILFRSNDFWLSYAPWTLKFGQYLIVTTLFAMLGDIDLTFGIWVYNDELQIKFAFRSGPMNFGRAMTLGLWNLAKYLVVTTFVWLYLEKLTRFPGDFNVNRNTTPSLYEKVVQHFNTNDLQQRVTNLTTIYGSTLDLVFTGGHLPSIIYNDCYYSDQMTLLI